MERLTLPYMVVVSDVGRERDCRKSVKDAGFACYMPTYREQSVSRGRKVWTERLLFGRYFFARWQDDAYWEGLLSLRLVRGLFMRTEEDGLARRPALIRDFEIDRIRASEDRSGHVAGVVRDQFVKGQRVRAVVGVMAGIEGNYVQQGRVGCDVALMDMLGRQTRVEFAPGVLQAA